MSPRPRSTKSKYHIALDEHVMKELKLLGVEHGKPVGDIIAGLLDFANVDRRLLGGFSPLFEHLLEEAFRRSVMEFKEELFNPGAATLAKRDQDLKNIIFTSETQTSIPVQSIDELKAKYKRLRKNWYLKKSRTKITADNE